MLLIMKKLNFQCLKKNFSKIQFKFVPMFFCYENKLTYPVHISDQKLKNSMDLLIISNKIKSDYVYIKDFSKFVFIKTKTKSTFQNIVYIVLAGK